MYATVEKKKDNSQKKQIMLWIGAFVVGAVSNWQPPVTRWTQGLLLGWYIL